MKLAILVCFLAVAYASPFRQEWDSHWENFKRKYGKNYTVSKEHSRRFLWEQNVARIVNHNLEYDLGTHSYRLGLNEYADMSHKEFVSVMNGFKRTNRTTEPMFTFTPPSNVELPETVDWRQKGLVTPVKNQGQCGSCWAFSTTGSLEGQHMKKTGDLVSLSEQNLVDCSWSEGNYGCGGGETESAFEYIRKNNGIDTEDSYPYEAVDGTCRFKRESVGATVTGYIEITSGDEDALQQASATVGPISVSIDASSNDFQLYSGGIYDEPDCSTEDLDHAVLVVGYGTEDGKDYWLVKNSWGKSWGLDGYIKMSRNKDNQCGIATNADYPLV